MNNFDEWYNERSKRMGENEGSLAMQAWSHLQKEIDVLKRNISVQSSILLEKDMEISDLTSDRESLEIESEKTTKLFLAIHKLLDDFEVTDG